MKNEFFQRNTSLFISAALLSLVGLYVWQTASNLAGGMIGYALDDAYIHMSMAKNLAGHGVWGVTPWEPVSASSSPGWVLLLTLLMKIVGDRVWLPLALNLVFAYALVYVVDRLIRPYVINTWYRAALVTAIMLALPIESLVASGMEHTLQMLLVAIFFGYARKIFSSQFTFDSRHALQLGVLAGLMILVRVECAVLLPIPFIYALRKRDSKCTLAILIGPLAALLLFTFIASSQGLPLEPNSMLLKRTNLSQMGTSDPITFYFKHIVGRLYRFGDAGDIHYELGLMVAALILLLLLLLSERNQVDSKLMISTCALGFILHAANGRFGWFYRYEGYLLVFTFLSLVATCANSHRSAQMRKRSTATAALVLACIACALMPIRAFWAFSATIYALGNIGHQQLQMAKFFARFYPNGHLLVNDIGAVCYYGNPVIVDDQGLGTTDIVRARSNNTFSIGFLDEEMAKKHIQVGAIYAPQLPGKPDLLIPVAILTIPNNVVCAYSRVFFVATSQPEATSLLANLHAFEPELPKDDQMEYVYRGP